MSGMKNLALVAAILLPTGAALSPLPDYVARRISYASATGRSEAILDRLAERPESAPPSFELVVEAFSPSVVTVYATVVKAADPFGFRTMRGQGLGSGVIVDEAGLIITNNHVVEQARSLQVQLHDGRRVPATLVGRDPRTDLAVIRVQASGLTPARFGDSGDVKVGQWVLAFGSPYGLTKSVTHGIVSAVGRANVGITDYENFIQTDASINRGNSGGPLVDMKGRIVGINTAIFAPSGGNEGIAFSIPANMVKKVMQRLIEDGKVVRGFLGISMVEIDEDLARRIGYDGETGVVVESVSRGGPAFDGGMRPGDVLLTLDGQAAQTNRQIQRTIADTRPGTEIRMGIWRGGSEQDLTVTVGELPENLRLRGRGRR